MLGSSEIMIKDKVANRGNGLAPHMLLYHINCGWPLIDEGTRIVWKGERQPKATDANNTAFNAEFAFTRCAAPMDEHSGFGEDVAFIIPDEDESGKVICGYANDQLELALKIEFKKSQMPWLINWQHWGINEYVTALEPATNPPIGQKNARDNGTLILLEPGETREYELKLEVLTGDKATRFTI